VNGKKRQIGELSVRERRVQLAGLTASIKTMRSIRQALLAATTT
jgi:hypothetical protein